MTCPRTSQLVVADRFNGPPGVGNGGYVCGSLAGLVGPDPVVVRLVRPVRLGVPLEVRLDAGAGTEGENGQLLDGDTVVARASTWTGEPPELPPAATLAEAEAASTSFAGHARHPFPSCFGCGPDRPDGLRIFPGPFRGTASVAAPWRTGAVPDAFGTLPGPIVWAALDCCGGWAVADSAMLVLGTMLGRVLRPVSVGEELVVTAAPTGAEGRRRFAASAVRTASGDLVAWSHQTWVEVA